MISYCTHSVRRFPIKVSDVHRAILCSFSQCVPPSEPSPTGRTGSISSFIQFKHSELYQNILEVTGSKRLAPDRARCPISYQQQGDRYKLGGNASALVIFFSLLLVSLRPTGNDHLLDVKPTKLYYSMSHNATWSRYKGRVPCGQARVLGAR